MQLPLGRDRPRRYGAPDRGVDRNGCVRLLLDEPKRSLEDGQHAREIVAALQDQPGGRNHAVGALLARQPGVLLDR